jgi:hypothetical protein
MYWLPNYVSITRGDMDPSVIITPNPITTTHETIRLMKMKMSVEMEVLVA